VAEVLHGRVKNDCAGPRRRWYAAAASVVRGGHGGVLALWQGVQGLLASGDVSLAAVQKGSQLRCQAAPGRAWPS